MDHPLGLLAQLPQFHRIAQQIEHINRLAGWNGALGGVKGLQGDFDEVHETSRISSAADCALTLPV